MKKQVVSVKVSAGARTEHVEETTPHTFKVRVQTAPEKGKATKRVAELLAAYYNMPVSSITLLSGLTSRDKAFTVHFP